MDLLGAEPQRRSHLLLLRPAQDARRLPAVGPDGERAPDHGADRGVLAEADVRDRMRRPRLLVLINNFPPDRGGAAAVYGDMCYGLAEQGFDVTVRCAYPYFPEWRDKSGRNGWKIWRYEEQGIRVERFGLYIPANPNSTVRRLLHELSFLLSLLRGLPRGGCFDLVMAYCPA